MLSFSVKMAHPHFHRKLSDRIIARAASLLSSFADVKGRPGLGSSAVNVLQALKQLNHSKPAADYPRVIPACRVPEEEEVYSYLKNVLTNRPNGATSEMKCLLTPKTQQQPE